MAATAKKKPKASKREPKAKQTFIPGTEPPSIPAIDKAAEALREVRADRMQLSEDEAEAVAKVRSLMIDHNLTTYEYDGHVVTLVVNDAKITVKKKKEPKDTEA